MVVVEAAEAEIHSSIHNPDHRIKEECSSRRMLRNLTPLILLDARTARRSLETQISSRTAHRRAQTGVVGVALALLLEEEARLRRQHTEGRLWRRLEV